MFDAISYCKGGAVIRMVHAVVGEAAFKTGLRSYMETFKYGNATTDDLWAAWEASSGQPVKSLMGLWTKQMGFPLLELVSLEGAKPDGSVTLQLKQRWFVADGSAVAPSEAKTWSVPLFAQTSASGGVVSDMEIMTSASHALSLPAAPPGGGGGGPVTWVKLNAGQHVPLRVKYPDSMMPALCAAVRQKHFSATDRIGLLSDHSALCRAGELDPVRYLELLAAYVDEDDATVLGMLLERLLGLQSLFKNAPELASAYCAFAYSLVSPQIAKLGWDPSPADGHLTRKLRGEVVAALPALCATDPAVVAEARRRYEAYVNDPDPAKAKSKADLPSEIAAPVLKIVQANGGATEFDALQSLFRSLELNDDKKQALLALGYAPTDELRVKGLEFAVSGEVKTQDFFYLMLTMHRASASGTDATWKHFTENLPKYKKMLNSASGSLTDAVISGACSSFATKEKADEVQAFFDAHKADFDKNQRKIQQTLEAIRTNAAYLERFTAGGALSWLQAYKPPVPVA